MFPWSPFLYAEGEDDEIRAVFTTHDVIVRGTALTGMLSELAGQRIARLQKPARTDRFEELSGPVVRQLIIERVQESLAFLADLKGSVALISPPRRSQT